MKRGGFDVTTDEHKDQNELSNGVTKGEEDVARGEVTEDDKVDTRCGVGSCKPSWLQGLSTIRAFVAFNALSNLFTYGIRMYMISQVTAIEKRFGFSSAQSGLILSVSQITFVICILFFSHYGRYSHIPRILSVTSMIAGATGVMLVFAHFTPLPESPVQIANLASATNTSGNASQSLSSSGMCSPSGGPANMTEPVCKESSSTISGGDMAMGIFLAAMLIQGAVTSPRTPLGGTYVDDNNPLPTTTGKYIGIMMGILTLAPVVSFGIGALSSRFYHTFEATSLTPRDPQWIGAWWLGFLVLGCLSILFSFLVFFFPKRLKSAPPHPTKQEDEKKDEKKKESTKQFIKRLLKPLASIFRIVKKPVFLLLVLANTAHVFALLGMASFFPKYLETQFYIPAYKTSIMLGIISIFGSTIGPVVGGFVTSHFKLTTRGNLRLMLIVCILLTIGCPIAMALAGQQTYLVKSNFEGSSDGNDCISGCKCSNDALAPVCGADGAVYFSPCHAGCYAGSRGNYSDCTCSNGTAVSGYCAEEDVRVYPLLVYSTLTSFTVTFGTSPSFMIIVRTVTTKDKSLALGLSSFISTLIGHFPAAVVYGVIVDSACSMWQETCSGRGACALYNLSNFRFKMFGTNMGLFFLSAVFIFIAILVHRRRSYDEMTETSAVPTLTSVSVSENETKT